MFKYDDSQIISAQHTNAGAWEKKISVLGCYLSLLNADC
jgi:hypothetical protein